MTKLLLMKRLILNSRMLMARSWLGPNIIKLLPISLLLMDFSGLIFGVAMILICIYILVPSSFITALVPGVYIAALHSTMSVAITNIGWAPVDIPLTTMEYIGSGFNALIFQPAYQFAWYWNRSIWISAHYLIGFTGIWYILKLISLWTMVSSSVNLLIDVTNTNLPIVVGTYLTMIGWHSILEPILSIIDNLGFSNILNVISIPIPVIWNSLLYLNAYPVIIIKAMFCLLGSPYLILHPTILFSQIIPDTINLVSILSIENIIVFASDTLNPVNIAYSIYNYSLSLFIPEYDVVGLIADLDIPQE